MIYYTTKKHEPFQIDEGDLEIVKHYNWRICKGYVVTDRSLLTVGNKQGPVAIHLFLLGPAPVGKEWDHRDRNPLNNQRENIRAITHQDNVRNGCIRSDSSTGYRGVIKNWHGLPGYLVYIRGFNNRAIRIGTFLNYDEAVTARIQAQKEYWNMKIIEHQSNVGLYFVMDNLEEIIAVGLSLEDAKELVEKNRLDDEMSLIQKSEVR